ncbi:MAG TPA: hypothetical protein VHR45_23215 [Thermoanaerobaculia bacterium]|nr:hypothetical protein [Thermoanaerobaculia bacterium]
MSWRCSAASASGWLYIAPKPGGSEGRVRPRVFDQRWLVLGQTQRKDLH